MRLVGTLLALSLATSSVFAADLFKDGKPLPWEKGNDIAASTTINGYPLYQDAGTWKLLNIGSNMADTQGDAESIKFGQASLLQVEPTGAVVGSMTVLVNLTSTGQNQYMSGTPCAGTHMVMVNKGAGLYDNCLTINANSFQPSQTEATYFAIRITQSRSGGRIYILDFRLIAGAVGFPGTRVADWQTDAIQASTEKTAFVERLKKWAVSLQDASDRAVEFGKPADAFSGVPSSRTLIAAQ